MTDPIPQYLLDQIRRGEVVLFLGAGASIGSSNRLHESPPLAGDLAAKLSQRSSLAYDKEEDDLQTVTKNAKKVLGDAAYQSFLREQYQHCTASDSLQLLSAYPWYRIYTINIDDAMEDAYRQSPDYRLEIYVHSSPIHKRPLEDNIVQLVKLNGSIDRLEAGLIFTPEEYGAFQSLNGRWYEEVARDFLQYTFLFIGTRLNEPLFRTHVDRMRAQLDQRPGQSFIVLPSFSEQRAKSLKDDGIVPLQFTIQDLANALKRNLGSTVSSSQLLEARQPGLVSFLKAAKATELTKFGAQFDALVPVLPEDLNRREPHAPPGLRSFYFGSMPTWRDILDGVPATLEAQQRLQKLLNKGTGINLVHGPAGCGKSAVLMSAALNVAKSNPECLVLWVRPEAPFPKELLREMPANFLGDLIVFVDDFQSRLEPVFDVLEDNRTTKVQFVLSERTNMLPRESDQRVKYDAIISMAQLHKNDVVPILSKLEKFGPWHRLGKLSAKERFDELYRTARKQLLVGLRKATEGADYDQIVTSEFRQLPTPYAQDAYTLIALASMHRLPLSVSTFSTALPIFLADGTHAPSARTEGLEDIVIEDAGWLRVRHQILADFTVSNLIARDASLRALKVLVQALSRFEPPIRRSARGPESRLFAALINHRFLWRFFKNNKEEVISAFKSWESKFQSDGLFWLQYALFEEQSGIKHLRSAIDHIRIAIRVFPDSHQIVNAYANIHFSAALNAPSAERALTVMEQATTVLEEQTVNPKTEAYAVVGLAKGRVRVVKKWFPDKLKEEVGFAEERLRELSNRHPSNQVVQQTLRTIALDAVTTSAKKSTNTSFERSKRKGQRRGRT